MREVGATIGKMSSSGRKRGSKWDLKEESRIQFEKVQDDTCSGKAGMLFHDNELQRDWLSPEAASSNRQKWSAMEHMPGRKGLRRDANFDEDSNRSLKTKTTWEEDESYGIRMSPGLKEWKLQNPRHSPINEWKRSKRSRSRSRSRSPVHGLGRESGLYDRIRSRSGTSTQVCKDFAAGGCRRGNCCHFLHQSIESNRDSWERHSKPSASKHSISHDSREYPVGSARSADYCTDFLKGNCRKGASCRFAHHGDSKLSGKVSRNEAARERDDDRRYRDASPDRRGEREPRRATDILCKFFAAGNCRNGKYCKFSHYDPVRVSPDGRSRDGRWLVGQNSDDVENMQTGRKWSDPNVSSDATKSNEFKIEKMGAPEPRHGERPMDDSWGNNMRENRRHDNPSVEPNAVDNNTNDALQWERGNAGDNMHISEQRTNENWIGDTDMSPEWHYKVQPSNHIDKGDHASLPSCGPGVTREALGQVLDHSAVMPHITNETSSIQQDCNMRDVGVNALPHDSVSVTGKASNLHMNISECVLRPQGFNQNDFPSNALPIPSLNAVGESQVAIPSEPSIRGSIINPQNQSLFQEGKAIKNADIGNANVSQVNFGVPATQSMVSGEQLTQLSNLLQLYTVQTSQNGIDMSAFSNSEGAGKPESEGTAQSNQAVGTEKQYDPACDSIEPDKHDIISNPPGFLPISQRSNTDGKLEIPSKNLSPPSDAAQKDPIDKSYQLNQQEPGAPSEATKENNGVGTKESTRVQENNKTAQGKGSLENIDGGDSKVDESKKSKDVKGIRVFKFALVEFVKEIMKPTWKEGQMSKDAYKNIVKKVVDKVTGSIGANIPQTQEKIEQYLSASMPKLTKLVQAYVEKFQKDK